MKLYKLKHFIIKLMNQFHCFKLQVNWKYVWLEA